jgi:hypothetical protein
VTAQPEAYAGTFAYGQRTCPLCPGRRMHTPAEHRDLCRRVLFPLDLQDWSDPDDGDLETWASPGHHPPGRVLAALGWHAHNDPERAEVRHVWLLWHPAPDGYDYDGRWRERPAGTGGAVPFTLAEVKP